jgi:hypothetical protein
LLCLPLLASPLVAAPAKPAKIVKVLPHYVDLEGRIALAPSLFERDAYQAVLRLNRTRAFVSTCDGKPGRHQPPSSNCDSSW